MKRELTIGEITQRLCSYCAQGEHCEQEVREKLYQWGCHDTTKQADIITYLTNEGYLSVSRYCHAYVHDKVAYQGWGQVKIRIMLQAKHLPDNVIEEALRRISAEDYKKALKRAVSKYGTTDRKRTIRFAMQRGFTYEEVVNILKADNTYNS